MDDADWLTNYLDDLQSEQALEIYKGAWDRMEPDGEPPP
jgi:hypothetical protein